MEQTVKAWMRYLPEAVAQSLARIPSRLQERIQEIRLRRDAPTVLSTPETEWLLEYDGKVNQLYSSQTVVCGREDLERCVAQLCEYSVHTHQQELREGYIHTVEGCRAGIAGRAVVEQGHITALRDITSVCLRIARHHRGCATELTALLRQDTVPVGTLICGAPGCGKTSLLRDLACQLAEGQSGKRYRVTVVDERGELALGNALRECDVLAGHPKPTGILQAVRGLAPDVILLDELGSEDEIRAISSALQCGVAVVATVHADHPPGLCSRPALRRLLETGGFSRVIFLCGRHRPGTVRRVCTAEEVLYEADRNSVGVGDGDSLGTLCVPAAQPTCKGSNLNRGVTLFPEHTDHVHGGSHRRIAAGGSKRGTVSFSFGAHGDDKSAADGTVADGVAPGGRDRSDGGWVQPGRCGTFASDRR